MNDTQFVILVVCFCLSVVIAFWLPFVIEFCIDTFWKIVAGVKRLINKIKLKIHPPKPLTLNDLPKEEKETLEGLLNSMRDMEDVKR